MDPGKVYGNPDMDPGKVNGMDPGKGNGMDAGLQGKC